MVSMHQEMLVNFDAWSGDIYHILSIQRINASGKLSYKGCARNRSGSFDCVYPMAKHFFHRSNFGLLKNSIEQLQFNMMSITNVIPSEQSHGNPMMHEPQSRMMNIHIMRLKLANYILIRN
jgi:hypothetical protein